LPRSSIIPDVVTAGAATVAVRCPDHPLTLELLRACDLPLVGPSANRSGGVSPTRAEHVRAAFDESDVLVLDGGACATGIESTVLLLAGGDGVSRVLRPGVIGASECARVLGREVLEHDAAHAARGGPLLSPGLLESHYAPIAPAVRFAPHQWPLLVAGTPKGRLVVLSHTPGRTLAPPHLIIDMPSTAAAYARELYDALRRADDRGATLIAVELHEAPSHADPRERAIWLAIADRLARATRPFDPSRPA
jgi:L-threonylcarbamoyladenylate synthase